MIDKEGTYWVTEENEFIRKMNRMLPISYKVYLIHKKKEYINLDDIMDVICAQMVERGRDIKLKRILCKN